jgi:histidine ammonia-lyase
MTKIRLSGDCLTRNDVVRVAAGALVQLDPEAMKGVARAADYLSAKVAAGRVIYGVTTGFGRNADQILADESAAIELQRKLILSHAVGVGAPLSRPLVRALMLLRLNTLMRGYSAIRPATLQLLADLLNLGIHPVVPAKGSVGASGDLAPLSHVALVLIGAGEAEVRGQRLPGMLALKKAGLRAVKLSYKEGLALNNGTSLMAAYGVLALDRFHELLKLADIAAAMAFEALAGRAEALDEDVMALRGHPHQERTAERLRRLLAGSSLVGIAYDQIPLQGGGYLRDGNLWQGGKPERPQDSYSLRCVPQVHGAVKQAVAHAVDVLDAEINAVTDNPVVFPEADKIVSAGNFHGMPIALALSYLKAAIPTLASIAERRLAKILDPHLNDGLPAFLCRSQGGTNSGLMLLQYSAAALVNDLASRSTPASAYSVPTSANTEDHVSMGTNEGRHVYSMMADLQEVLSLELLVQAQALELRCKILGEDWWPAGEKSAADAEHRAAVAAAGYGPGPACARVLEVIREQVPFLEEDRELRLDLEAMRSLVASGAIVAAAESVVGPLDR